MSFSKGLLPIIFIGVISSFQGYSQSTQYGPDIFVSDPGFKVVGYLSGGNFDQIDLIELDKITHLCLAFANPDTNGNLRFRNGLDVSPVVEKAHKKGVKVLVSLAGGGKPDAKIWKSMLDSSNRRAFIKQITDYVQTEDLDGVDVDIEWNLLPAIDTLYEPFVIELRQALHALGKMMTSALNVSGLHPAVTQESLLAFDFINIMVYDKTGPWRPEVPGQHAPYTYAEEAYQYWTRDRMIPAEKLTLGVPFYGHNFNPPGSEHFASIVQQDVANAYKNEIGALYYNGIHEIVRKTELAKKIFNGVMIWELSQDTHDDLSLLRAIDQTLRAGDCKVSIFFKDEDNDGHGNLAKPYHACEQPNGYVVKNDDRDDTDASIHPGN